MKKLLVGLLILVVFQWLGEWAVRLLALNIPGQLLGMIFLLILIFRFSIKSWMRNKSDYILKI